MGAAMNSAVKRNIILLQVFTALQSTCFLLPVIVPYYRDAIGLDFHAFLIGEAVFSAVVIAMEVPTGWLSDTWRRKHTMCLGMGFYVLGYLLLYFAGSLLTAAGAQGLIGVGVSLISGTINALLYDTLAEGGRVHEFRRLEGRRHGTGFYALAASSLIGGFLYSIDPHLPLRLSLVTYVVGMVVALFLHEPLREKQAVEKHPLADMLATLRYALHGHKEVAGIILFCMTLFSATKLMLWSQQPYYALLGLPEHWYGMLMAGGFALSGAAGHLGHLVDGRMSNRAVFRLMLGMSVGAFALAGLWPGLHGVALLLFGSLMYGFGWPRIQDAINKRVSSGRRATILSAATLMINTLFIPLSLVYGAAADRYGIAAVLAGMGLYLLVAGCACLFLIRGRMGTEEQALPKQQ